MHELTLPQHALKDLYHFLVIFLQQSSLCLDILGYSKEQLVQLEQLILSFLFFYQIVQQIEADESGMLVGLFVPVELLFYF